MASLEHALPTLALVSLDALASIGATTDPDLESAARVARATASPPANTVVTSSTPGSDGVVPDDGGVRLAAEHRIDLARRLRRAEAVGKAGEVVVIELEDDTTQQLLVLGLGDGSVDSARIAGAALAKEIDQSERVLCTASAAMSRQALRAFCEGILLASYRFSRKSSVSRKSGDNRPKTPVVVELVVAGIATAAPVLAAAVATAHAVAFARDLTNTPSNEKTPQWIAEKAQAVAAEAGLAIRVLDESRLVKERFGGILAVGSGSAAPPRLVILSHRGEVGAAHVVLVGKGVTFDSGGLSIKPADAMPLMKTDMAGAAAVLAVMGALPVLRIPTRVTALLACAENMPSGSAYRPGDVVRHYGGRTSEVLNTDAEGRMVLADALAYAAEKLKPDAVIDIATLTGAATLGLSHQFAALYSDDDGLAQALERAGRASNDNLWRMPLVAEYRSSLDSPIADITHVSRDNVGAGSIIAALFLREFTGGRRWAHLDIAGPGRATADRQELMLGATGFGVRVLLRWLESSPELW